MKKLLRLNRKCMAIVALCLSTFYASAQNGPVRGVVTSSEDGEGIPGATVLVKGTTNGTVTDIEGNYSLDAPSDAILQISFLGYMTQEVNVAGRSTIGASLKPDAKQLEEVVVVGYGSVKKSDITGSVSSVKSEDLQAFPVLDAVQALQGRAAGVVVQSNNGGEPGAPISIQIRGNTSINASSAPLIVVDGFVGATMPQANDIASMEVLKDASATAIYGSRGSNGVILVTTKRGTTGKTTVNLVSTYSVQNASNKLDLLNADDFADYQQEIRDNRGIDTDYEQGSANTDWQDLIYTGGSTQNHQLSVSGGSEAVNFYASGNYFKQDGILVNSGFERVTFLSNIDAKLNDKVKVGLNLFGSRGIKDGVPTQSDGSVTVGGDDVVSLAMRFAPDEPIRNDDGSFTTNTIGDPTDNPYAVATERVNEVITNNFRSNLYASYDILEGLNFKTTLGYSTENQTDGRYQPSTLPVTAEAVGGRIWVRDRRKESIITENYLTYTKNIGDGNLTALAGYSYQKNTNVSNTVEATGSVSNSFSYHGLSDVLNPLQPESSNSLVEIQSQFGRLNYDYGDRYLVTATVRRDGASNFSENNKYAIFPSAAIGWRVSNEGFLKDDETVSNLKFRASYGLTGNPSISAYGSLAKFDAIYASSDGSTVSAVTPEQPSNTELKWETSKQTNIGLDLGLFEDRVSITLDYYDISTEDLILNNNQLTEYVGYSGDEILVNAGEINNKGFEFTLNTVNVSKNDFRWNTNLNFSANKNTVTSLVGGLDVYGNGAPSYFSVNRSNVLREGEEVGLFWGYDYIGVYDGGTLEGGQVVLDGAVAGDPMFRDIADEEGNFDGELTEADNTIIGNPNPDFTYGISNTFTYKNFDLNIFIQGSQGNEIFNMTNVQLHNGDANTTYDFYENAWRPDNTDTNTPRVGNNSSREISSRFVEDGSYIRLKNISIGYNLPTSLIEKVGIERARFAVSAQNLLTITNYSGLDPEVNYYGDDGEEDSDNDTASNTTRGFDFGNYPTLKSFNFSLTLQF